MGQAKQKREAIATGNSYIDVKDMKGVSHLVMQTDDGNLLITDGPYKGFKIRLPARNLQGIRS